MRIVPADGSIRRRMVAPERGLAGAGLADQPHDLAGRDRQRDVVDRLQLRRAGSAGISRAARPLALARTISTGRATSTIGRCVRDAAGALAARSRRRPARRRRATSATLAQRTRRSPSSTSACGVALSGVANGQRGCKPAAGGRSAQVGKPARNGRERALLLLQPRDRGQQALGVGMHRRAQHVGGAPLLDHLRRRRAPRPRRRCAARRRDCG